MDVVAVASLIQLRTGGACPRVSKCILEAHIAGSLQVFSLGSLRVILCSVSKTDNWVNCNSLFNFIFGKYIK